MKTSRTEELRRSGARNRNSSFSNLSPGEARELVRAALDSDPWASVEQLRQIGHQLAAAEAQATRMDAETKSLKARLQTEYATAHAKENLSEAKLERLALADERYGKHLNGLEAAIELREKIRHDYWAVKASLDLDEHALRHVNALSRIEG
jgi:hypothetical protein